MSAGRPVGPAGLKDIFVLLFGCARQYCTRDDPSRAGARHTNSASVHRRSFHAQTRFHTRAKYTCTHVRGLETQNELLPREIPLSCRFKKISDEDSFDEIDPHFLASPILNFVGSNFYFPPRPFRLPAPHRRSSPED